MAVETFIGWRYLRSKRKQTFISVISLFSLAGVALGVAALIVVLAVISGTERELKNRILDVNSHVVVVRFGQPMEDHPDLMKSIAGIPGVDSVQPFIYSQVLVSSSGGVSGAVLRGIDPEIGAQDERLAAIIRGAGVGDLDAPAGKAPRIILGKALADKMKVERGQSVRLMTAAGRAEPQSGRAPQVQNFEVIGKFDSGMNEYDATLVYVSLKQAQNFLGLGNGVTGLEVKVQDIYQADKVRERILARVGSAYWARDWMQTNRNIFAALKLQKTVMFIILSLTILVAAFNIISTLIMAVMEKTREIAILKSMGATSSMIMRIFVFQGMLIGLVGTLLGLGIGTAMCQILSRYRFITLPPDVYFLSTMPVHMETGEVLLVLAASLVISFLATLYPAWQASRLNPCDGLRYE